MKRIQKRDVSNFYRKYLRRLVKYIPIFGLIILFFMYFLRMGIQAVPAQIANDTLMAQFVKTAQLLVDSFDFSDGFILATTIILLIQNGHRRISILLPVPGIEMEKMHLFG